MKMKQKLCLLLLPVLLLSGCDDQMNPTEKTPDISQNSQIVEDSTKNTPSDIPDSVLPDSTSKEKTLADENYAVKRNFRFGGSIFSEEGEKMRFSGKIYENGFYLEAGEENVETTQEFYFVEDENPYLMVSNEEGKYYYGAFQLEYSLSDFLDFFDFEKNINENVWEYDHTDISSGNAYDYFKVTNGFPVYPFEQIIHPVLKFENSVLSSVSVDYINPEDEKTYQIEFNILEIGNQKMDHDLPNPWPDAIVEH